RMRSILSDAGAEPALWEVDTALRPEGKAGALVRTLSEFEHYYADIAQNWEFQALLKARPVAGDAEVAEQFSESLMPLVWQAAGRATSNSPPRCSNSSTDAPTRTSAPRIPSWHSKNSASTATSVSRTPPCSPPPTGSCEWSNTGCRSRG